MFLESIKRYRDGTPQSMRFDAGTYPTQDSWLAQLLHVRGPETVSGGKAFAAGLQCARPVVSLPEKFLGRLRLKSHLLESFFLG
jgi:hypothetical protein